MAGSVNKVILIGNLGADPEIRRTQDGRPIANLRVATSESWRDKTTGERKEKTEWHRVVIFNEGLCKIVEQYLKKGSKVYLEGALQTRKWTDKDGHERYSTEVVLQGFNSQLTMLDTRGGGGSSADSGDDFGSSGPSACARAQAGAGRRRQVAPTWTTRFRSEHLPDAWLHSRVKRRVRDRRDPAGSRSAVTRFAAHIAARCTSGMTRSELCKFTPPAPRARRR